MVGSDERAVADAERSLYRAMVGRDFATLDSLLSPELRYVHSTGVAESKATYLEGVANGRYEYETIASREVRTRVFGSGAMSSGIVDMSVGATGEGKRMMPLLFVLVWTRRPAGGWQLDYRQATRLATP